MMFYGESLLALGILTILIAVGAVAIFILINILISRKIRQHLAEDYGEKLEK